MQKRKIDPIVRLNASTEGQTKCVIFVDEINKARASLEPYANTIVGKYPFINAFGALLNIHSLSDISKFPCVKAIAPHTTVTTCLKAQNINLTSSKIVVSDAFQSQASIAVIDTGLLAHLDFFIPRMRVHFIDFINGQKICYDDNGHGTAVSSILCSNGLLSGGVNAGIIPTARLFALKAIGGTGEGGAFAILEAMQWIFDNAEKYNIRVVCMSFGSDPVKSGVDPLSSGAEALWKKGIVVVASAGNDGPEFNTIKSPGINPYIITVGGAEFKNDEEDYEKADMATKVKVPDFSSRGPAGNFSKPDLIAPAVDIVTASICNNYYTSHTGTSMAAPIVAGFCAKLLSENPNYTPNKVKEVLLNSCIPIQENEFTVGRGLFLP